MKNAPPPNIEKCRIRNGPFSSTPDMGMNGLFEIPYAKETLNIIVSDQMGWDHVSISIKGRRDTPGWDQMCWVKRLFFEDEEIAVQFHPPESKYVNIHPGVLHLWRDQSRDVSLPPLRMV